jgi:hypothetical protein
MIGILQIFNHHARLPMAPSQVASAVSGVGMAVAIDLGSPTIHPPENLVSSLENTRPHQTEDQRMPTFSSQC